MRVDDILDQAVALLREQIAGPAQIHPRPGWASDAQAACQAYDEYRHPLRLVGGEGGTRWRPIDSTGGIATNPAPAIPDDPNEGETGPAEVLL